MFEKHHVQMQRDRSTHVSVQTSTALGMSGMLWGPLTRLGLMVAAASAFIDQASKLWLIHVYDLGAQKPVQPPPFLELVLTWNPGISYGLFKQSTPFGRWALLAVMVAAAVLLWLWLPPGPPPLPPGGLWPVPRGGGRPALSPCLHAGGPRLS